MSAMTMEFDGVRELSMEEVDAVARRRCAVTRLASRADPCGRLASRADPCGRHAQDGWCRDAKRGDAVTVRDTHIRGDSHAHGL
jgi:hypothetical protein